MATSDLRAIVALNVQRMIDAETPKGARPSVRAWAMARGLNVRLIDRLVKREHAVTLDTLQEIADACGLKPWQLLLEDLDPAAPAEAPISEDERMLLKRLRRLLGE